LAAAAAAAATRAAQAAADAERDRPSLRVRSGGLQLPLRYAADGCGPGGWGGPAALAGLPRMPCASVLVTVHLPGERPEAPSGSAVQAGAGGDDEAGVLGSRLGLKLEEEEGARELRLEEEVERAWVAPAYETGW
jgi:hypothetical protein